MLSDLIHGLCDLVFPPHCFICHRYLRHPQTPAGELCPACYSAIGRNQPPWCIRCTRPLPIPFLHNQCLNCRTHPMHFDFAWSAVEYTAEFKPMLHEFKYQQKTLWRHLFSRLMLEFINEHELDMCQFDYIVPIPLFFTRMRERGYNQSELLAKPIAQKYQIPLLTKSLIKHRPTVSQSLLSRKNRWTNIQGTFKMKQPIIRNSNILIIDDLMTTGATASQAALVLKKAGAATVGVLTLAIAT